MDNVACYTLADLHNARSNGFASGSKFAKRLIGKYVLFGIAALVIGFGFFIALFF